MPTLSIPAGWRLVKVGEILPSTAKFNASGAGTWEPVNRGAAHRVGKKLCIGLVEFIMPLEETPRGNKVLTDLEIEYILYG